MFFIFHNSQTLKVALWFLSTPFKGQRIHIRLSTSQRIIKMYFHIQHLNFYKIFLHKFYYKNDFLCHLWKASALAGVMLAHRAVCMDDVLERSRNMVRQLDICCLWGSSGVLATLWARPGGRPSPHAAPLPPCCASSTSPSIWRTRGPLLGLCCLLPMWTHAGCRLGVSLGIN